MVRSSRPLILSSVHDRRVFEPGDPSSSAPEFPQSLSLQRPEIAGCISALTSYYLATHSLASSTPLPHPPNMASDPRYDGTNMSNSHRADYAFNDEPGAMEAQQDTVSPHPLAPQDSTAKPPVDGVMNGQGYESESTLPTDGRHSYQT